MKHFKSSSIKSPQDDQKLSLMSSSLGANFDTNYCTKCSNLENQLTQKETYIQHLRSYQTMLTDQMQNEQKESDVTNLSRILKKQINDSKINEKKLRACIDELNQELNTKDQKLHQEGMLGQKLSQSNIDLKRSIMNLEQDILKNGSPSVNLNLQSPDPKEKDQKNQTLKKQQELIEIIERDYQNLNQRYHQMLQQNSQDCKFIQSLVQLVVSCHPINYFEEEPNLKWVWNWFKNMMKEYMSLKQIQKNH